MNKLIVFLLLCAVSFETYATDSQEEECVCECDEENEVLKCVKACPPERTCQNRNIAFDCLQDDTEACKHKCVCKKGYYRNAAGKCVTKGVCDSQDLQCNRPYEVSKCVNKCPPESTCINRDAKFKCRYDENEVCQQKCVCEQGYHRNAIGDCISTKDCAKCRVNEHEFFSCGSACDNTCADIATQNRTRCPIQNIQCNKMCYCEDGYARNEDKKCIPIAKCMSKCVNKCPPESTCKNRDAKFKCRYDENEVCQQKCVCEQGYHRNAIGDCISTKDCDSHDLQCNRPHEVSRCVRNCPPESTCKNRNMAFRCRYDENEVCQQKCICEQGYHRNAIGDCISTKDCAKCRVDEHEFFSCGSACDNSCANIATQNRTHCPILNVQCNKMCYCEDGYARNEYKKCIPIAKCSEGCKGPYEVKMKCRQSCIPDLCASIVSKYRCDPNPPPCQAGCFCQEGYLRQKTNSPCMLTKNCREMQKAPGYIQTDENNDDDDCNSDNE